jgi:murein DD-endopeptidase MepM/ murein hydrolase activator NlpD
LTIKDRRMTKFITLRAVGGIASLTALVACTPAFDPDLRSSLGGFSTSTAARSVTGHLPTPDARGVINYPTYQVVVAREGDKIGDVAARVGLPADELARFNVIAPNKVLRKGEIIALPRRVADSATPGSVDIAAMAGAAIDNAPSGSTSTGTGAGSTTVQSVSTPAAAPDREPVRHQVARGETAYTIARLYDVPVRALAEWNGLGPELAVREGQFLLIPLVIETSAAAASALPGEGSATPTPPSAGQPLPSASVDVVEVPSVAGVAGAATISSSQSGLHMPLKGRISRDFQRGTNNGIDISGGANANIHAAEAGKVAGITRDTNEVSIVVLEHSDGLLTIYVGLGPITVSKGDRVTRGQVIAQLPNKPDASLHFEVREGIDNVVDPNNYFL